MSLLKTKCIYREKHLHFFKNSRMDSKNIFYHFASLKRLLTEADKKLLKALEDSLEKKREINLNHRLESVSFANLTGTGPITARNE